MHPLLSLIVVTHNHTQLLPRLLDSVLEQRFAPLEVVVVDDCSNESCDAVVGAYRNKGLQMQLIRSQKHIQTKAARLLGVSVAKADYIGFADADDILWGEGSLAYHANYIARTNVDMLHFRSVFVDAHKRFRTYTDYLDPMAPSLEGETIFSQYLKKYLPSTPTWTKLYRKALWEEIRLVAEASKIQRYLEDHYLTSLLFFHAKSYASSERIGYAQTNDDRRDRSAGRAVAAYLIATELGPYFKKHGCPELEVSEFVRITMEHLNIYTGRFCRDITMADTLDIIDAELDDKLQGVDRDLFFKVLLLSTSMNEMVVKKSLQAVYQPSLLS